MGFRERRASPARRLCALLLVIMAAAIILPHTSFVSLNLGAGWGRVKEQTNGDLDRESDLDSASRSKGSVVFTCPDGRHGLHVVQTRFLISQADVGLLFTASRLHLMETLMVPSLATQTSKNFVLYASYDPNLSNSTIVAFKDTLELIPVHSILNPESSTNSMALGFKELTERLRNLDPRVENAKIYVISRLDVDDAAHVRAVEAIQQHACSHPENTKLISQKSNNGGGDMSNIGNDNSIGDAPSDQLEAKQTNVRVMYITNGTLWFPTRDPLGVLRVPRPIFKIYRNLAVMQSMILTGAQFIASCQLDVYSYPHYKPQALEGMQFDSCPKFEFNAERDVHRWSPPRGEYGWLYSKTSSSWTAGQIDHKTSSTIVPMDIEILQKSFGIDKAALAMINLMFTGLAKEASSLLEGNTELELE